MQFSCLQEHVSKSVTKVIRVISTKPQLPILSSLYIHAQTGMIKMVATNLETTIITHFPAKVAEEGIICLPARLLTEFLSTLSKDTVTFSLDQDVVTISCGRTKASIPSIEATEFPPIPSVSVSSGIDIDKSVFVDVISSVLFSSAQDEARPLLMGVLFEQGQEKTSIVATDGYRLSVSAIEETGPLTSSSVVFPAKALGEVLRLSGEEKDQPTIRLTETVDGQLVFSLGETTVSTRRIDGDYPKYKKIIPSSHTTEICVEKEELLRATKSAALFARESSGIIRFSVKEASLEISANTPQIGENRVEIDAEILGEQVSVALNSRFVLEFLQTVKTEQMTIRFTGALTPVVFELPGKENFLHIIMPVRIND